MKLKAIARNVRVSTAVGLWICVLAAIGMYCASFFVPPTGVIDESVLKAGAWLFAFAGLFEAREAIHEGLGFKLTHGNTTVEVKDVDGNEPQNPEEHEAE